MMKKRVLWMVAVALGVLLAGGCEYCLLRSRGEQLSREDFNRRINAHWHETINNVWYMGSDDEWDYFIHNTTVTSKELAVRMNEIVVPRRFPVTNKRVDFILMKGNGEFLRYNPPEFLQRLEDDGVLLRDEGGSSVKLVVEEGV